MVKYLGPTVLDYLRIQHTILLRSTTHRTSLADSKTKTANTNTKYATEGDCSRLDLYFYVDLEFTNS